ncbi:MAG: chorismate-binding protein [bacterium]|nr:chorismate-binding protein [bacterium]
MLSAQPLEGLTYAAAYARLAERPEALYATAGEGFGALLAQAPLAAAVVGNRRQLLEFDWAHSEFLVWACLSYDFGHALLGLPRVGRLEGPWPLGRVVAFGAWLSFDEAGLAWLEGPDAPARAQLLQSLGGPLPEPRQPAPLDLSPQLDAPAHQAALAQIFDWIRAGEFYQVNYTQTLQGQSAERARHWFLPALGEDPPAYAALFEAPEGDLLSLSPELLLATQGAQARTEPIKGTRPRGNNAAEDAALQAELDGSAKEEAELFMITDLLRNDLGRMAEIGSVEVAQRKVLRLLPGVIHSHSVVTAQLKPAYRSLGALVELLPGGSISGCPKRRALELIDRLEPQNRGLYTGSLALRWPGGDLKANLLIRSLQFTAGQVSLGVGGGITIESNPPAELEEAQKKARSVLMRFQRNL